MIKNIIIAVLAIVILGFGVVKLSNNNSSLAGGTTNFDSLALTGLQLGSSGTIMSQIVTGTCNLLDATLPVASSITTSCAVTGVVAGDLVFANLATSTANAVITSSRASTTAGFITVRVFNLSTTTATTLSTIGSSTAYLIVR